MVRIRDLSSPVYHQELKFHLKLAQFQTIEQVWLNTLYSQQTAHLLTLSAKTEKALEALVFSYKKHLETYPELAIADICFSANAGRSHFNHRLAVVGQ